ncbi:tetratricopeptide repeat protein [Paenibacillus senegalensis]|uniref:tetratricopeptide repeat protein n=1 Tax=Paenibacillus senegalensis TaxID=1465766 RepID=UPI0002896104|nr:tetratricopeptide repeat protein [Paenibacillus senegalensis]
MFKPIFATMHELLSQIKAEYPSSSGDRKQVLEEQLLTLKSMSDTCIDEWIRFEEELTPLWTQIQAELFAGQDNAEPGPVGAPSIASTSVEETDSKPTAVLAPAPYSESTMVLFDSAQGYYKLGMFVLAKQKLEAILEQEPDFMLARLYLALCCLHLRQFAEAYRHLTFVLPLVDHPQMKAISHTALGCIYMENNNLDKALECFGLAYEEDPYCVEPVLAYGAELRW